MRQGTFSRTQVQYGASLSVVKPPKNDPGSYLSRELLDPSLALTQAQQYQLQGQIDDLFSIMRGEQQIYPRP